MFVVHCLTGALVWHCLRSLVLTTYVPSSGSFSNAFLVMYKGNASRDRRNTYHSRIGLMYASGVVALTTIILGRTTPSWWWQLKNNETIVLSDPGAGYALLTSAGSYFVSDMFVISDFPQYTLHHTVAISLIAVTIGHPHAHGSALAYLGVTEIGAIMLNAYSLSRKFPAYVLFMTSYFLSRAGMAAILYTGWRGVPGSMQFFCCAILAQNIYFMIVHASKFRRKWNEYRLRNAD